MTINIQTLIEARDSLDEAIADLELPDDRAPQPVVIDEHGTYRFRANPIVQHLLNTHQYEEMDTISRMFSEDRAALSQFSQLIGYQISGAGGLDYANAEQIDGAQQSAELMADNDRLKTQLGHAMIEHNQVSCEARDLHSQVADLKAAQIHKGIDPVFEHMRRTVLALESENKELKAAQTPRPMSEAPDPGTHAYVVSKGCIPMYRSDAHENWCSGQIIGWLPLPVDQGEDGSDV